MNAHRHIEPAGRIPRRCPERDSEQRVIIWMTDYRTGHEHAVTVAAADFAVHSRTGIYEAICDTRFMPAPLTVPARFRCPLCTARNEQRPATKRHRGLSLRKLIKQALQHRPAP